MSFIELPRVGYVVKQYPRYSETFIVNEILAHERAGLALEIFSLRPPSDTHFQDILARVRAPVSYIPCQGFRAEDLWRAMDGLGGSDGVAWDSLEGARGEDARDVCQGLLLAREVRRRGIGHLHAHFASVATTVARLASRFAGVPYTFTAHAKDIFHESVRPDDLGRKIREARAVVTVSEYNRDYLEANFDTGGTPIHRVYNGLDLAQLSHEPPSDRPPTIVSVGRLVEKKGFADLIDACAILAEEGRAFDCRIVGGGELEQQLRARIERHGLESRVKLLGPKPQAEVIANVGDAAVFAAPCVVGADGNRDGLPTVLLEAMALGTPCISTDVTGIPEVLLDGETGLMVPQRNPEDLASALARLLDEPELRARLASRARRLIEDEFDADRNTARLRSLFGEVMPAGVLDGHVVGVS